MMEGGGFQPSCEVMLLTAQECSVCVVLLLLMAAVCVVPYLRCLMSILSICLSVHSVSSMLDKVTECLRSITRWKT